MEDRATLPSGTLLDEKYRIDGVIGTGALGITYTAFDTTLAAPIAIKEYFPEQIAVRDARFDVQPRSDADLEAFERGRRGFMREAQTLAQFNHRHIVEILNVLAVRGTVYMMMRLEAGGNLRSWRDKLGRPPTQAELDRILAPLLDALEVMHASNFLHRDIGPDSIVIRPDGSPVLLGFGATRRVTDRQSVALTRLFTAGFSPPEQYMGDGSGQGPWTDIYALGGTIYWLLTGDDPPEAAARMADDRMQPVSAIVGSGYRPQFLEALDHASRVQPRTRPQSIAAWRAELLRNRLPEAARPVGEQGAAPLPTAVVVPMPPPPELAARRSRYRRIGIVVAALLATGGLMALASYPFRDRSATPIQAAAPNRAATPSDRQPPGRDDKRVALSVPPPVASQPPPTANPPAETDATLVADIRTALNRVGCKTDATSSGWADADQKALESFAHHSGGTTSFLSLNRDIVRVVSAYADRVCPVACGAGEVAIGDHCLRKPATTEPAPDCSQISKINERAQIGLATDAELQFLRSGRCKP